MGYLWVENRLRKDVSGLKKTTETVRLNPCCPWGDAIIGEAPGENEENQETGQRLA